MPAQVVGQFVSDGALNLRPQKLGIVAEVALQGVLVDDDAVWVDVAGDGAADVVAVRVMLATAAGDDHRRALEQLAELLWQVVQRLHHQLVELGRWAVGGRQGGESFAAVDQPPELGLGYLLTDQRHGRPGGDEHDRHGTDQQCQQATQSRERWGVEEQEDEADDERRQCRCPQRWAEGLPHTIQVRATAYRVAGRTEARVGAPPFRGGGATRPARGALPPRLYEEGPTVK